MKCTHIIFEIIIAKCPVLFHMDPNKSYNKDSSGLSLQGNIKIYNMSNNFNNMYRFNIRLINSNISSSLANGTAAELLGEQLNWVLGHQLFLSDTSLGHTNVNSDVPHAVFKQEVPLSKQYCILYSETDRTLALLPKDIQQITFLTLKFL